MTSVDGSSNTALVSEVVSGRMADNPAGAWGYGEAGSSGYTHKNLPNSLAAPVLSASAEDFSPAHAAASSLHPGVVNVVYADMHGSTISDTIDLATWQALGTCNGGEAVIAQ